MKAEFISLHATDLTSVNAARTSMAKHKEVFDSSNNKGSDKNLLAFLAREFHFTPFTHPRETFVLDSHYVRFSSMTETDMAGMVKEHNLGKVKMRHSIFGWANMIEKGLLHRKASAEIASWLHTLYPHNAKALGVPAGEVGYSVTHRPVNIEHDRRFIDVTLRITVPFFVIRQLDTHKVGFARNEQSGRYIKFAVEFFKMQWRKKPAESIKQGSGGKANLAQRVIACVAYGAVKAVSHAAYSVLLAAGLSKEQSRAVLPLAAYTQYYLTGSIAAFKRMYDLRIDPHAQQETGEIAVMIRDEIEKHTGFKL